jgi:hypothetical protein
LIVEILGETRAMEQRRYRDRLLLKDGNRTSDCESVHAGEDRRGLCSFIAATPLTSFHSDYQPIGTQEQTPARVLPNERAGL